MVAERLIGMLLCIIGLYLNIAPGSIWEMTCKFRKTEVTRPKKSFLIILRIATIALIAGGTFLICDSILKI